MDINRIAEEAVSEIQRRLKARDYALIDFRGRREPVMTTEEMKKIIVDTYEKLLPQPH